MIRIYLFFIVFISLIFRNTTFAQHYTKLYGVTSEGGNSNLGTIYQYDVNTQTQTVLYNNTRTKGKNGVAALTEGGNGKLYGVTTADGSSVGSIIYEVDPNTNIYTAKYNLTGGNNGLNLISKLVLYNNEFYGVAGGGPNLVTFNITQYGAGVIFKWNPITNVYTKLADFDQTLGGLPVGDIILYNNKMYGVTYYGGTSSNGTIYEFNPATNVITKQYDFASSSLLNPGGGLYQMGGNFYGITNNGGINNLGTIYEWNPSTTAFNIRYSFDVTGGNVSEGSFTEYNSNLYCLTSLGGALGLGTLLEFNPVSYTTNKLIDFGGLNGGAPAGNILIYNNELYGATKLNGVNGFGTIFKYNTTSTLLTKLYDFTGLNGSNPYSNLALYSNKFYATTYTGGTANGGVVYSFDPSNNAFLKIEDLDGTDGAANVGSLNFYNGKFYGIDSLGGEFSKGVIYEFEPQNATFTKLYSFDGTTNGDRPNGELYLYNGKFYGTTKAGGSNSIGILYEFDPTTNTFTKRIDFTTSIGSRPVGGLAEFGGKLYGCANLGGTQGKGTIFEYNVSTNSAIVKVNLTTINGANPYTGMVLFSGNNKMYGVTENGGQLAGVSGVLFEYNPSTNAYVARINFNTATGLGNKPTQALSVYNGKIYGATRNAGTSGLGTVFKYDPLVSLTTATKIIDNTIVNGTKPNSIIGLNGELHLSYDNGGSGGLGSILSIDTITNAINTTINFNTSNGAYPIGGQLYPLNLNYKPVFSNIPASNNGCNNINGESIFTITDAENDPLTFTFASSNTSLIPNANLSITNLGGNSYKLIYTPIAGQTGSSNVSITVDDGFGGITTDTISVNVFAAPTVNATASANAICIGNSVTLSGSGASSYAWTNGITDLTAFSPINTATYIVTGTDANGCTDTAQATVIVNALPIINITPSALAVCIGASVTLSSNGVLNPTWDNGVSEGIAFTPSASTTYTVSGSDANGCNNSNSITITVNALPPAPSIVASLANPVCVNSSLVLIATNSGGSIFWNGGSFSNQIGDSINFIATANDTYSAIEINTATACTSSVTSYSVIVNPCLGLKGNTIQTIEILPNPGHDYISIQSVQPITKVSIMNTLGNVVLEAVNVSTKLNINQLASGVYTIELTSIEGKVQKKWIKY
jgi:uncharacterized repeat protein (TIGR03803 family)